jgi:hypothetical protein
MTGMFDLWLPILLASVAVFIVSSVIHMAPLWHKNDYPRVPDEDKVRSALRPLAIPRQHPIPSCLCTVLRLAPPVPPFQSRLLSPAL